MRREEVLRKIKEAGVVAVVRGDSKEQGLKIVEAAIKGGIKVMELTMTVPNPVEFLREVAEKYRDTDIIVGAGTVLDAETARACILAGAEFIVSPSLDIDTLKLCNRYKVPYIPGVMTINEIVSSHEVGVDIVKIFPGSVYGPSYIKAIKGPLPYASMMVTGGVNINNIGEWFKSGVDLVGIGGELNTLGEAGKFKEITEVCNDYIEKLNAVREG